MTLSASIMFYYDTCWLTFFIPVRPLFIQRADYGFFLFSCSWQRAHGVFDRSWYFPQITTFYPIMTFYRYDIGRTTGVTVKRGCLLLLGIWFHLYLFRGPCCFALNLYFSLLLFEVVGSYFSLNSIMLIKYFYSELYYPVHSINNHFTSNILNR